MQPTPEQGHDPIPLWSASMNENDVMSKSTSRREILRGAGAMAGASLVTVGASLSSASFAQAQEPPSKGVWKFAECALLLVDYQPEMLRAVRSETSSALIELNVRFLIRAAKAFGVPVILSTVGVGGKVNSQTVQAIADELPGTTAIDRSTMDAWEDVNIRSAVEKTGRKRLVFAALWTEICLAYQIIDALRDGYEAMFIVDAVGGLSQVAHETAIRRLIQAGAIPNTSRAMIDEWFRDWKTPQGTEYRAISAWYGSELQKLAGASGSMGG
ncbi:isochorismatase family protein [Mesorhizobium sp. B2-4-14]|nr:isochorismatase family protein [Mesorhizobium sp. B2-4-14]